MPKPKVIPVALFCDNIIDAKDGTQTLVGIFPDKLGVASVPSAMARLAIYFRILVDPAEDPGPLEILLLFPNGEEKSLQKFDPVFVDSARKRARDEGLPYAGLLTNALIPHFPVLEFGRLSALVSIDGEKVVCGAVNFVLGNPSDFAQPSLLSLSVAKGSEPPSAPSHP
jgi:hypothetical protein